MGKVYVRGGTPNGSESRCKTCSYAHIMTGYRESEMITACSRIHPNILVPFNIYECTGYYDKNRPSYQQMQKLAIDVTPGPMKPVGFKVGVGFHETAVPSKAEDVEDDDFDYDDD